MRSLGVSLEALGELHGVTKGQVSKRLRGARAAPTGGKDATICDMSCLRGGFFGGQGRRLVLRFDVSAAGQTSEERSLRE